MHTLQTLATSGNSPSVVYLDRLRDEQFLEIVVHQNDVNKLSWEVPEDTSDAKDDPPLYVALPPGELVLRAVQSLKAQKVRSLCIGRKSGHVFVDVPVRVPAYVFYVTCCGVKEFDRQVSSALFRAEDCTARALGPCFVVLTCLSACIP